MPHQCTECGRTFPDGSKEMLSGCPDCGGNKFQFDPDGSDADGPSGTGGSTGPGGTTGPESGRAPGRSEARADDADPTGRAWPTYGDEPDAIIGTGAHRADRQGGDGPDEDDADDGIIEADEAPTEDSAQAAARSGFAGPFEVENGADGREEGADAVETEGTPTDRTDATVVDDPDEPTEEGPDLADLREELNDQFESIRIQSPGQYELNLMELYDREEYIISLKEDGRYVIEVPETWRNSPDED
jgi:predicted  nucleic acid-binding Zn-ribbon protein